MASSYLRVRSALDAEKPACGNCGRKSTCSRSSRSHNIPGSQRN